MLLLLLLLLLLTTFNAIRIRTRPSAMGSADREDVADLNAHMLTHIHTLALTHRCIFTQLCAAQKRQISGLMKKPKGRWQSSCTQHSNACKDMPRKKWHFFTCELSDCRHECMSEWASVCACLSVTDGVTYLTGCLPLQTFSPYRCQAAAAAEIKTAK